MKPYHYLLPLLLFILACNTTLTGDEFRTEAVYSAHISGLSVWMRADGEVPAGEDIGSGKAVGWIICKECRDTLFFEADTESFLKIEYRQKNKTADFTQSVEEYLQHSGRQIYDEKEITEVETSIKAAASGPKSTFMEGQTQYIKVVKVEFDR